jgi:hypothetical protein
MSPGYRISYKLILSQQKQVMVNWASQMSQFFFFFSYWLLKPGCWNFFFFLKETFSLNLSLTAYIR